MKGTNNDVLFPGGSCFYVICRVLALYALALYLFVLQVKYIILDGFIMLEYRGMEIVMLCVS